MPSQPLLIIVMTVLGGGLYRFRGSSYNLPNPITQAILALPFAIVAYEFHGAISGLLVWVFTILAIVTGNGRENSLSEPLKGQPEKEEFFTLWLLKLVPIYWYKFIVECFNGFLMTLPCGLALLNPWLALSGSFKGPCYAISWKIVDGTWLGEVLTGCLLWGALAYFSPALPAQ